MYGVLNESNELKSEELSLSIWKRHDLDVSNPLFLEEYLKLRAIVEKEDLENLFINLSNESKELNVPEKLLCVAESNTANLQSY